MLTLLGSLLGFATSAIPDIMSMFRERADRQHELAVLDRQMEQMRLGHNQRLVPQAIAYGVDDILGDVSNCNFNQY